MANSGLFGPHALTEFGIDAAVKGTGAGAYALGSTNANGVFTISYVGRSDTDLSGRLKDHVGSYMQFKFGFYSTPESAYLKECSLYHDFGALGANHVHPARPEGSKTKCPVCGA